MVNRNRIVFTKIALTRVKTENIKEGEPPLQSTLRTPRRRRNLDLFVKQKVLGFDRELFFTILAGPSFPFIHDY